MTTSPAPETPRPVTVPTLQDRARVLEPLGWSGREAEWIALVASPMAVRLLRGGERRQGEKDYGQSVPTPNGSCRA